MPTILLDRTQFNPPADFTGRKMFACAEDSAGNTWNGSAFVPYANKAAKIAGAFPSRTDQLGVGVVERDADAVFLVFAPSAIAAADWWITYYFQAGMSPATSDLDNPVATGSAAEDLASVAGSLSAIKAKTDLLSLDGSGRVTTANPAVVRSVGVIQRDVKVEGMG